MPEPDGTLTNRDFADNIVDSRIVDKDVTFEIRVTAPRLQTASTGRRTQIDGGIIRLFSGDSAEAQGGFLFALPVGTTAATKYLRTSLEAPTTTGGSIGGGTRIHIESESGDDSSHPPTIEFVYDGGSTQKPLAKLSGYDLTMTAGDLTMSSGVAQFDSLGSSTSPVIGMGSNYDDGMYSPADSELALTIGGSQELLLTATTFQVSNVYNSTDAASANVTVTAAGSLRRNASALAYKPGWEYTPNLADRAIPPSIMWPTNRGVRIGWAAEHVADVIPEAAEHENYDLRPIVAILVDKIQRIEQRLEES